MKENQENTETLICYKLVKVRKDKTLGSLFIHRTAVLPLNTWLKAEYYPTKGYAPRFGWHCTFFPYAPHLSENNRVWVECEVKNYHTYDRPESQGGAWILADKIRLIRILDIEEVKELRKQREAA